MRLRHDAGMEIATAAACLAELGHATRLEVFRFLVRVGPQGAAVGTVQEHLAIPASTLSHHLARLVAVGLVAQERQGRVLRCRAAYTTLGAVMDFLRAECCTGLPHPTTDPGACHER